MLESLSPKSSKARIFLFSSLLLTLLVTQTSILVIVTGDLIMGNSFRASLYNSLKYCARKKWRFASYWSACISNCWVCAPPFTSITLVSPFCCEKTLVTVNFPNWNSVLIPNKLWLPVIKDPGKGRVTLPASTLFTISSSLPIYSSFV